MLGPSLCQTILTLQFTIQIYQSCTSFYRAVERLFSVPKSIYFLRASLTRISRNSNRHKALSWLLSCSYSSKLVFLNRVSTIPWFKLLSIMPAICTNFWKQKRVISGPPNLALAETKISFSTEKFCLMIISTLPYTSERPVKRYIFQNLRSWLRDSLMIFWLSSFQSLKTEILRRKLCASVFILSSFVTVSVNSNE